MKINYIDKITKGSLIAFKLQLQSEKLVSGIVISVQNKESDNKEYVVQTKNGIKYTITKEYIAWVNIDGRWPKGVMEGFRLKTPEDFEVDNII